MSSRNFWIRSVLLAERYAARPGAPVYMYSLDWQSPAHGGRLKAHHAMDLPFVFDNTEVADTTAGKFDPVDYERNLRKNQKPKG